jgi:hypothetical protein
MTDPSFNLAMAAKVGDSWYTHLPAVEAAMAEDERIAWARHDAGWTADEGGWFAPDGTPESDWEAADYPFPEDVPAYREWHSAFYHYDALDAGVPTPDPYPNAPAKRRVLYATPSCPE